MMDGRRGTVRCRERRVTRKESGLSVSVEQKRADAPLAGRYWPTVLFVLLALCPDLFLSTGMTVARQSVSASLHAPVSAIALGETFSNAGWAFGAVLAADLAQRFSGWKLNVLYEAMFIAGSILGAAAPTAAFFVAGRVLQGTATGMLLVSALPPIIRGFPVEKLGITAGVTNLGLFGAVTAGPVIGGYVAVTGTWRWFFAAMGLLAVFGLILAVLVVRRQAGFNPGFPFDAAAIALAAAGAGLTFYGVGNLGAGSSVSWTAPIVWIPTALGIIATGVLIVYQYRHENALMPVKPIATTYPMIGIIAGVLGGAAYTSLLELLLLYLRQVRGYGPLSFSLLLWPGILAAMVGAFIFGKFFNTRYVLLLPLLGVASLVAAAWLLTTTTASTGSGEILWLAGILGVGAGLTVSPALFMAGLSVKPMLVGRAFALVEMLRLAGAFAIVPAFTYFAMAYGMTPPRMMLGLHYMYWVILIGLVVTIGICSAIFLLGGARIHAPDLRAYLEDQEPALESPPVLGRESGERPPVSEQLRSATRNTLRVGEEGRQGRGPRSRRELRRGTDGRGRQDGQEREREPRGSGSGGVPARE